jgi:C4-dicarboxylate transporter DctQ subunit
MTGYTPHLLLFGFIAVLFIWERLSPRTVEKLEDNLLILLMALLTLVSFGQVVARYLFNTGWSAALEFTMVLFSWLILVGMSYGIRRSTHLGVDIVLKLVPRSIAKGLAILGAATGLIYSLVLLDASVLQSVGIDSRSGAIEYWSKMYKINIGTEELRWPEFIQETFGVKERVQRWLVLIILPIGLALLAFRSLQAMIEIYRDERDAVIAGHESEDLVNEHRVEPSESR